MPLVNVRDTKLHYESAGNGEPTLLFIHGMCGGAWTWRDQMERLSSQFRCVAYDRRGHTRSEAGTEDQSNRTHADDAAALIDALGLDRPVIVGSSAGGAIAMELVLRYPDHARGAIVLEPALFGLDPAAVEQVSDEIGKPVASALERGGPRAAVDAFFEKVCSPFWKMIDESKRDLLRDNAQMLFATLQAVGVPLTAEDLATVRHPVLVVAAHDPFPIGRPIAFKLDEILPNSELIDFEDCGHVAYAEKPAEFADAVIKFVRERVGVSAPAART